jgi:hypothetical protein
VLRGWTEVHCSLVEWMVWRKECCGTWAVFLITILIPGSVFFDADRK